MTLSIAGTLHRLLPAAGRADAGRGRPVQRDVLLPTGRAQGTPAATAGPTSGSAITSRWNTGQRADLDTAFDQLRQYALVLENPPLLIVSDMRRFRTRINWTNSVSQTHEFDLDDLGTAGLRSGPIGEVPES